MARPYQKSKSNCRLVGIVDVPNGAEGQEIGRVLLNFLIEALEAAGNRTQQASFTLNQQIGFKRMKT